VEETVTNAAFLPDLDAFYSKACDSGRVSGHRNGKTDGLQAFGLNS
jgi:hypothetical protein